MSRPVRDEWRDQEAPWWAKLRRARLHVEDVRRQVRELERGDAWSIEPTAGRVPTELTFRLRIHRPVPADLKTAVGDVIHNLRSALDTAAFELATHGCASLNATQRRSIQFPICRDATEFEAFFDDKRREGVFGAQEQKALRSVQPFAFREEARALGVDVDDDPENDLRLATAHSLNRLSNIDKHRGFPDISWVPRLTYWISPTNGDTYDWVDEQSTSRSFNDGDIVGYLVNETGTDAPTTDVFHDVELRITDDPGYGSDLPEALDGWLGDLARWVLPRLFIVAEGNKPPMMIG